MYDSIIHHLYIVLCAHHPKLIFCHHVFDPLYPLLSPTRFPLVTATLLSVSVSSCLLFGGLFCFVFSVISHIWVKSHGFWPFLFDLFKHDVLKLPTCYHKWQYFIFSYIWVAFHCMWGLCRNSTAIVNKTRTVCTISM